jgi:hypothetical protein
MTATLSSMKPEFDMFSAPREKGQSEWQTFNAVHRDTGAYTVSAFPALTKPKNIVRYNNSRLLILKRA